LDGLSGVLDSLSNGVLGVDGLLSNEFTAFLDLLDA
jgi:hypothetical protein